jgi:hypothetical protein
MGSVRSVAVVVGVAASVALGAATTPIRRLVLEEQRIEGKVRRPQLVLIKADERPSFGPIVVHSVGSDENITKAVRQSVIEASPYTNAFRFADKKIVNYVP